jgi:hypothetical protein
MKIRQMGAELFSADGRDEANGRFSQFREGAEKYLFYFGISDVVVGRREPRDLFNILLSVHPAEIPGK